MFVHGDRHLQCVQRPHTHGLSHNTRSVTHTPCLIHTDYTTHTHGGTHPRCFFRTPCRVTRTRGLFRLRCPFIAFPVDQNRLYLLGLSVRPQSHLARRP